MNQKLRGLGELVAYLPYVLGFIPRRSVVVVGSIDGTVGPISRIDIPPSERRAEAARLVVDQLGRVGLRQFDLVGYDDEEDTRRLMATIRRELSQASGAPCVHEVHVREGQWSVARCACGGCERDEWQPVPEQSRVGAIAEQVLREVEPYADRDELAASVALAHPLVAQAMLTMVDQPFDAMDERDEDDAVAVAWSAVLVTDDDALPVHLLPVDTLLDAVCSLQDKVFRDELMGWMAPDALGFRSHSPAIRSALDDALGRPAWRAAHGAAPLQRDVEIGRVTHRLQALVACTPDVWVDGTATLLAYWCWAHGSGALAGMALDRALDANPAYSLAHLIGHALSHGLRPGQGDPSSREIAS
ncbi:DUF4192 domain-containing protein [Luteipulveratus mongoliensis]|uniref:DUF4192 domain-containing protein n=1 Tax=Luteipulveratus mongoliensis TaxID=571913 RepID=A0A0K1JKX0_9MICO|nr:DUF4192 domain-containing protein [Luteipulveratus mongoliensis]AKU17223.1 hypothetical protein VV02_17450 [Luteipulveratus mongoliensis]